MGADHILVISAPALWKPLGVVGLTPSRSQNPQLPAWIHSRPNLTLIGCDFLKCPVLNKVGMVPIFGSWRNLDPDSDPDIKDPGHSDLDPCINLRIRIQDDYIRILKFKLVLRAYIAWVILIFVGLGSFNRLPFNSSTCNLKFYFEAFLSNYTNALHILLRIRNWVPFLIILFNFSINAWSEYNTGSA